MTRRALGNRVGNRGQFVMSLRLTHRVWKHKGLLTQGLTDAYSHWSPCIFEVVTNYLGRGHWPGRWGADCFLPGPRLVAPFLACRHDGLTRAIPAGNSPAISRLGVVS